MSGLLVMAVAATELEIELRRDVDRRIGETGKFLILGIDAGISERKRTKERRQVDRREGAGLDQDEVLENQSVLMRIVAADKPIEEARLVGEAKLLRELLVVRVLCLDEF